MRKCASIVISLLSLVAKDCIARQDSSGGTGLSKMLQPYEKVIVSGTRTSTGILSVHQLNGRFLFEIPPSLLSRDLLVVNRIARSLKAGSNLPVGFAGDEIGKNVIRFTRGPNHKLFIHLVFLTVKSKDSSANGLMRAVERNQFPPIVASFDIKTYGKDSSMVIDVTDYFNTDNEIFFFDKLQKELARAGSIQPDKSYIEKISVYPRNIEIRTVKTYHRLVGAPYITFELNSSIVALPEIPMRSRFYDPLVGFFPADNVDFDASGQGVVNTEIITRWRLEPKEEDRGKYLRGELVEPQKPIVFYIDPATPKKWVPYLIQGVNDWRKAFEKAGFKNAITGREAPEKQEDSTWSLEDARFSAIVYKPAFLKNASGPHVHDPRTGEILESHINWYHNVMSLIREWYFVQVSPNDPGARAKEFNDTLMGRLIRYVVSHEVGHALGLMHNFGASSTVPVRKLREKDWVEKNGFCPSIMDYARFNYVAQPEDNISSEGLIPRIGPYDEWAVEWGYRWFPPFPTAAEENKFLDDFTRKRLAGNPTLWFGLEVAREDPRCQAEDLGDDAVYASQMGIRNLRYITAHLLGWMKEIDADLPFFSGQRLAISAQYERYIHHVTRVVGGEYGTYRAGKDSLAMIDYPSKEKQRKAMRFLDLELFNTPYWLIDSKLFLQSGGSFNFFQIQGIQKDVLEKLTSNNTFKNLLLYETNKSDPYTVFELMEDIRSMVWKELKTNKPIDLYRRNLQKIHAERLISLLDRESGMDKRYYGNTDIVSIVKWQIKAVTTHISRSLPYYTEPVMKAHLMDVRDRLTQTTSNIKQASPIIPPTVTGY